MKKFIEFVIALFTCISVYGQHFEAQVFTQQTVMGAQQGYGLYLKTKGQFGLGFVQQTNQLFANEAYNSDHSFTGIGTLIPLETCGKLTLILTPKLGLINRRFLAFLPEITTRYQLFPKVNLGLGAGLRARKSAASLSISYQLF